MTAHSLQKRRIWLMVPALLVILIMSGVHAQGLSKVETLPKNHRLGAQDTAALRRDKRDWQR